MPADPTELLPTELLGAFLDLGDTATILRASHVCARWRATARGCPGLWRRIRIAASSLTALELFRARINSSASPGINVTILIYTKPDSNTAEAVYQYGVVAATARMELEKHLHRIGALVLSAAPPVMTTIAPALAGRAGVMSLLVLQVPPVPGMVAPYLWPKNWVSDHTPRLRAINLENIAISITEPEQWFAHISEIKLVFTKNSVFVLPSDLFHRFPRAQKIHIGVNPGSRIHVAPPVKEMPHRTQPYSVITLGGNDAVRPLLPMTQEVQ